MCLAIKSSKSKTAPSDRRGDSMVRLLFAVAVLGSACGRSPFQPAEVVVASGPEDSMKLTALALPLALAAGPIAAQPPGLEQCAMHIEQEGQLLRAFYDAGECYPPDEDPADWHPRWVQIDYQEVQLTFEVMDYPHGRRADPMNPRGWYFKPIGPVGTFDIQARSGHNN